MILGGVTLEQAMIFLFAGGPGFVALIIQAFKYRGDKPVREANLAQTLTATAGEMLDRMQKEIDELKAELRAAEDQIIKLEERVTNAQQLSEEVAIERDRRVKAELELETLKKTLKKDER